MLKMQSLHLDLTYQRSKGIFELHALQSQGGGEPGGIWTRDHLQASLPTPLVYQHSLTLETRSNQGLTVATTIGEQNEIQDKILQVTSLHETTGRDYVSPQFKHL